VAMNTIAIIVADIIIILRFTSDDSVKAPFY